MQHEQIAEAANEIAADLPPEIRPMFLQGCGLVPGFGAWVEEGLARTDVQTMDARAHLHNVRCPVHLFHGRRDNVIPHSQMTVLANALSSVDPKTYLTGLYEHGRSDANALRQIPTLVREIATMAAMVHAMVLSGTRSA
jgi:pimeloyl-ACP methyl ester carboxylesterase